jgi:membrane-bound inhibitor of C-type lysozyme
MKNRKILSLLGTATIVISGMGITSVALADATNVDDSVQPIEQQKGPGGQHEPGIVGKVSTISGTTITLDGKKGFGKDATDIIYTVDDSNATVKKIAEGTDGKPYETTITVSDIKAGDMIMVKGTVSGTTVTATEIMSGRPGKGRGGKGDKGHSDGQFEPGVRGKVTAVSGTTITLTDKKGFKKDSTGATETTYTVDAGAATIKKITEGTDGKPSETTITVSDIKVGDMIMVKGTVSGTTVTATEIMTGRSGGKRHGDKGGPGKDGQRPPSPSISSNNQ